MQGVRKCVGNPPRSWGVCVAGAALTSLSLAGCAGFWDEVTSRDFKFDHLFSKPNPFLVLQNSNDGDQRARAFRALREPKQLGGSDQDQDAMLNILSTGAISEKQFLCRMAAIEALGRFQDPRAVPALTRAFYQSSDFPPDLATRIQVQALASLGKTRQPEAEKFLEVVVRDKAKVEGSDQEKQQNLDVRLAAARALGNFSDPHATEVLQGLVKNDKDVALRDCAHDALAASAGPKPFVEKAWEEFFPPAYPRDTSVAEQSAPKPQPSAVAGKNDKDDKFLGILPASFNPANWGR